MRNIKVGDKVNLIVGGTDCGEATVLDLKSDLISVRVGDTGKELIVRNTDNVELVKAV